MSEIHFNGHQKQEEMAGPEREEHGKSNSGVQFLCRQSVWVIPTLVGASALTWWLFSKGSKGSEISSILSPLLAIVSIASSLLMFLYENTPKGDRSGVPPINLRRTLRLSALLAGIILGAGGPVFYWTVIHKQDSPVTDQVSVSDGQGMHDGEQATIQIPGRPPQRDHLAIVLTLTNPAEVGDCVRPARLDITSVIDGRQRQLESVRPDQEIRLDLSEVTHSAAILVTLHTPDPACAVDLRVGQAVLYN